MRIINADWDAKRSARQNIRKKNLRLKKVQVIDEVVLCGSTTTPAVTVIRSNKKQSEHENTTNKNEDTEHMKLFEEVVAFFALTSKVFGMKVIFNWPWKKTPLMWLSFIILTTSWVSAVYTVYIHCLNNDYVRILEPLAVSGLLISVSQNFGSNDVCS